MYTIYASENTHSMGYGTNRWTAYFCSNDDIYQCVGYFSTKEKALEAARNKYPFARINDFPID